MLLVEVPPLAMPKVWQVCFLKTEREYWWDRFLPDGFRHVFLLGYVPEYRQWVYFDPQYASTVVGIVTPARAGALLEIALHEGAVVNVPASVARPPACWARLGFYCVPAVKHALGLRCVAVTPKGLHDYLLKIGAKRLEREDGDRRPEGIGGIEGGAASAAAAV